MRRCVPLIGLLLFAAPLAAQRLGAEERRPKLAADADTNDAAAYLAHGERNIEDAPDVAAAAFYWAARLDPSSAEALYGRRIALLMRKASDLNAYVVATRRARENKKFLAIDSLHWRALRLDPMLFRKYDHAMSMAYYRFVFKDYLGGMNRREVDIWLQDQLIKEPPTVRAEMMLGMGRLDQALIEYEDAIARYKQSAGLRLDRARIYAMQGQNPKAIAEFRAALGILKAREEKKDYVVFYDSKALVEHSIGLLQARMGNVDSAKAAFGRAMTEDLAYFPAHLELGRLSLEARDTATAVSELALAADLATDEPFVHHMYGSTLLATGQHAEAVAPLRKAIALEPLYAAPHLALAQALERGGDATGARGEYERFLALASRRDPQRGTATARLQALTGQ